MTSKLCFFFLFSTTLALADLQSEFEKLSINLGNQVDLQSEFERLSTNLENEGILKYYQETDPLQQLILWELYLGHILLIAEKGKEVAVKSAVNNLELAEAIKTEWNIVIDVVLKGQTEFKITIDGLRSEALSLAPKEWYEYALLAQSIFADYKKACYTGNPHKVRKTLIENENRFHQAKVGIETILASRRTTDYNF